MAVIRTKNPEILLPRFISFLALKTLPLRAEMKGLEVLVWCSLFFDIIFDDIEWCASARSCEIAR